MCRFGGSSASNSKNSGIGFWNRLQDVELLHQQEKLVMADATVKSNKPEEENQPEVEKAENLDNRLPYETPKLRKHGKVNYATKLVPIPGFFDGPLGPLRDLS